MNVLKKPPISFWIISIVALLWNFMGVYQYYLGNYELESLRETVTAEEFNIMESLPSWYAIVFAVAVFSGVIACIALLLRKKIATLFFMISLITVLIVEFYWLLSTGIVDASGYGALTMPLIVVVISFVLYFYSKNAASKGWIN